MYFDYAATTPIDKEILDIYIKIQNEYYANTTSLHKFGVVCFNIYQDAMNKIKETLNIDHEIIFTSNATEANNISLYGYLKGKSGRAITTKIEHPSVLEVFKKLEEEGLEVIYLDVLENGVIDLEMLKNNLNNQTLLVSIMWVNNIVGSIQPIKEVIEILKDFKRVKLAVDIVQGITKIKPNFSFNDIDMLTYSAHKFYGPKGIGCLLYKKNINLNKIMYGSSSQNNLRPGTFDLGLVVATAKALIKYMTNLEANYNHVQKINTLIKTNLSGNENIIIHSDNKCSPYIISLSILSNVSETITRKLDLKDIYVSSGSACSSKVKKSVATIYEMTKNDSFSKSVVRISLSHLTTVEEANLLIEAIKEIGGIKNV